MEFPRRAVIVERGIAVAMLAAAAGAAWLQRDSTLLARSRDGGLWTAWSATAVENNRIPDFSLIIYRPTARRLAILHVPPNFLVEPKASLERVYRDARQAGGAAAGERAAEDTAERRLRALSPTSFPPATTRLISSASSSEEPADEGARALRRDAGSWRYYLARTREAWRAVESGTPAALDTLLLLFEIRRIRADDLRAVELPSDDLSPPLLARLFSEEGTATDIGATTLTAELLNASGETGLASRTAKILRLRGVDVLTLGAAHRRETTFVFDRTGDYGRAARVRSSLGCESARAETRVDPSRAVDVSIELGTDCAQGDSNGTR